MTRATAGKHRRSRNVVLPHQLLPFLGLIVIRGWPIHLEHFGLWPDEHLGLAMTLDAPLHLKRRRLISQRHQVNSSVTRRTADTLVYVNAVIEIDEVREIVDPRPPDRFSGSPAFAYRFQIGAVRPNL